MPKKDKWVLCCDCHRVFKFSEAKIEENVDPDLGFLGLMKCCPYEGCDGVVGTACDTYHAIIEHYGITTWPRIPKKGEIYDIPQDVLDCLSK